MNLEKAEEERELGRKKRQRVTSGNNKEEEREEKEGGGEGQWSFLCLVIKGLPKKREAGT